LISVTLIPARSIILPQNKKEDKGGESRGKGHEASLVAFAWLTLQIPDAQA
jgi:hypothetical protein